MKHPTVQGERSEPLQTVCSQQCLYASTVSTSGNDHVLECYWNAIVIDVCPTSSARLSTGLGAFIVSTQMKVQLQNNGLKQLSNTVWDWAKCTTGGYMYSACSYKNTQSSLYSSPHPAEMLAGAGLLDSVKEYTMMMGCAKPNMSSVTYHLL